MCPRFAVPASDATTVALELVSTADTLRSSISKGVRRAAQDLYGRGASRARTYLVGDVAFCVLEGALTPIEQALRTSGRAALVRRERAALAGLTARKMAVEVEGAAGITVTHHVSEAVVDLGVTIEVMLLSDLTATMPALQPDPGRAEIANAVARAVHEFWGKGPRRTRAFLEDEFVFCVMEEPLTEVERALRDAGDLDLVRELRREFCALAREQFEIAVRCATGRDMLAVATQVIADPELCFLVFALGDRFDAATVPRRKAEVRSPTVAG